MQSPCSPERVPWATLEWLQRKIELIYAEILAGSKKKLINWSALLEKNCRNSMQQQGSIAKKAKIQEAGPRKNLIPPRKNRS
jgi:hypothetical protein